MKLGLFVLGLVLAGPTVFVAVRCYGSGGGASMPGDPALLPPGAAREESLTFLTLPEWLIVYSAEEYARFIAANRPSGFPYVGAITQYWRTYGAMCAVTRADYAFQAGSHVMLGVIGASFTVEHAVKGFYENTIGRLTEWLSSRDTPEDRWAAETAREYGEFLHTTPWYRFPFGARLAGLWRETPLWGAHPLRAWERRMALTAEYAGKAAYGWLIGAATQGTYGPQDLRIHAVLHGPRDLMAAEAGVEIVRPLGPDAYLATLPRYEAFTQTALALDQKGVRFSSVAGNDEMLVTALVPADLVWPEGPAVPVASLPILTEPATARLALRTPVAALQETLAALRARGARVEHLYDY